MSLATLHQTPLQIAVEICRENGVNWKLVKGPGRVTGLLHYVRLRITERLWMDGHSQAVIAELLNLNHSSIHYHVNLLNNRARLRNTGK